MTKNKLKAIGLLSIPAIFFMIFTAQTVGYVNAVSILAIVGLVTVAFYFIITKAFDLWYM